MRNQICSTVALLLGLVLAGRETGAVDAQPVSVEKNAGAAIDHPPLGQWRSSLIGLSA